MALHTQSNITYFALTTATLSATICIANVPDSGMGFLASTAAFTAIYFFTNHILSTNSQLDKENSKSRETYSSTNSKVHSSVVNSNPQFIINTNKAFLSEENLDSKDFIARKTRYSKKVS